MKNLGWTAVQPIKESVIPSFNFFIFMALFYFLTIVGGLCFMSEGKYLIGIVLFLLGCGVWYSRKKMKESFVNVGVGRSLAELVESNFGVKSEIRIMGPIIGAHVGPNAVALTFISNEERKY